MAETIDEWKLLVLMLFGGVFALAGLGLLVYRSSDATQTHAELFGLKFRISSSGLVVFLVGAAFLAAPLVIEGVPRQISGDPAEPNKIVPAPVLDGEGEKEPNNFINQANGIKLERVYSAAVSEEDRTDIFAFETGELPGGGVRIVFGLVEGSGRGTCYQVLNDAETIIGSDCIFENQYDK